jgi:hypothetical protein
MYVIVVVHVDGASLCLSTAVTNGPVVHPTDDIYEAESHDGVILRKRNRIIRIKPVPVPFVHHKSHTE